MADSSNGVKIIGTTVEVPITNRYKPTENKDTYDNKPTVDPFDAELSREVFVDSEGDSYDCLGIWKKNSENKFVFSSAARKIIEKLNVLNTNKTLNSLIEYNLTKNVYRGYFNLSSKDVILDPDLLFPESYKYYSIKRIESNGIATDLVGTLNSDGTTKSTLIDLEIHTTSNGKFRKPTLGKLLKDDITEGQYGVYFYGSESTPQLVQIILFQMTSVHSVSLALAPDNAIVDLYVRTNRPYLGRDNSAYIYQHEKIDVLNFFPYLRYFDNNVSNISEKFSTKSLTIEGKDAIDTSKLTDLDLENGIQKVKIVYKIDADNSSPSSGQSGGSRLISTDSGDSKAPEFNKFSYTIDSTDANNKKINLVFSESDKPVFKFPNFDATPVELINDKDNTDKYAKVEVPNSKELHGSVWLKKEPANNRNSIISFDGTYINTTAMSVERNIDIFVLANVNAILRRISPVIYINPNNNNLEYKYLAIYTNDGDSIDKSFIVELEANTTGADNKLGYILKIGATVIASLDISTHMNKDLTITMNKWQSETSTDDLTFTLKHVVYTNPSNAGEKRINSTIGEYDKTSPYEYKLQKTNASLVLSGPETNMQSENELVIDQDTKITPNYFRVISYDRKHTFSNKSGNTLNEWIQISSVKESSSFTYAESNGYTLPSWQIPMIAEFAYIDSSNEIKITAVRPCYMG